MTPFVAYKIIYFFYFPLIYNLSKVLVEMTSQPRTPEPNPLKRSHAIMDASQLLDFSSDSSELELEHDSPDLAAYLSAFDVDPADRIKMCRAYASYLSAQVSVAKKRAKAQPVQD